MKSFTKLYVFIVAMLFSVGMIAQGTTPSIQQEKQQEAQMELQAHGPSVIVPLAPEGGGRAVGDNCTDPIIISVPAGLPYSQSNTTCGRGNTYQLSSSSCMYYYTSGEDIIYRLDVTSDALLTLTLNPGTTTYSGMGIFDGCPNTGNCVAAVYSYNAAPKSIEQVMVYAGGQYYVMIDTWASPTCIPSFTLNIIYETPPPPPPPGSCDYSIALEDSYGDGWNGCSIDVLVDGVVRLNNITLPSGSGPMYFTFPANTGAEITTTFSPGSWVCEPFYTVYDSRGDEVFYVPNNCNPIIYPGQLYGDCPIVGSVEGYCTLLGGMPAIGTEVGIAVDNPPASPQIVDPTTGYYRINDIENLEWPIYAFLDGVNYIVHNVQIIEYTTVQNNYLMAAPLMVISPVVLEETMNPNEWRAVPISIVNGGAGDLHWTAAIEFGPPPAMGNVAVMIDPATPIAFQTEGDVRATVLNDGTKPAPANITEGEMVCTAEDPIFAGPPVGSDNGQGSEVSYGWLAGQHFTTDGGPIGSIDWWGITFGTPPNQRPYRIIFYDNGASPASSNVIAQYDVLVDAIPTGVILYGNVFKYHVEFEEPADVDVGWVTIQSQANDGFIMYWMNTTSINAGQDPPYFNLGGSVGPYAMCLGGSAGGGWLDLSAYEGNVAANGGSGFVNALFDATGTVAGQVWTATINFTAEPNISTTPVSVSMIIAGEPLMPVTEFSAELVNMVTGAVQLAWSAPANEITFEYYLIRRNGQPIANTTNLSYVDILPTYGTYYYTLSAVYAEGESVPAGPEEVIWLIPELCYTPATVSDSVWVGQMTTTTLTLENCGEGVLAFEFTDFDDPTHSVGFVKSIQPYSGQIEEGESMDVTLTFSAVGYGAGTYNVNVPMTTNELAPDNERNIACQMIAYTPATFYGSVVDCNSNAPIAGVTVTATGTTNGKTFVAETKANGTYTMLVDAGTYDLNFFKLSYEPYNNPGWTVTAGNMVEVNGVLCETPYPVNWVLADPNEADTQCMVTWSLPMGPYEVSYDDGEADNYFAWVQFGGAVAVKFTPAGYPATVIGGRLYVGDGSYPVGGNFIGTPMAVGVLAADGPAGFPGTVVDSMVVTVDQYGWISFGGFNYTIESGNFYLAMWQLAVPPNCAPIGIDTDVPTVYRSYTKQAGQSWKVSTYQDFMFRAVVFGPGQNVQMAPEGAMVYPPKPVDLQAISQSAALAIPGTEKIGEFTPLADMSAADRDLVNYSIAFVDNFDPDAGETPMDGDLNILNNNVTNNYYNYTGWGAKPAGFYAFAVKANYESSESVWAYSNVAAHLLDNVATFNVTLCDGGEPTGASLVLHGHNYPYQHLMATVGADGVVVFDSVIDGRYTLSVNKFGYQSYIYDDLFIYDDIQLDVVLEQSTFPPRNLYVDPLTSVATWEAPIYVQVPLQTFEDPVFPPAGWMATTSGAGWFRTNNGSSSFWTIPSGDGYYACSNDDANSGNNGANDYLITPELNLTATADYNMYFYSFYNGAYGQQAYVEYTTDGGATWEELSQLTPAASWTNLEVDISSLSGQNGEASIWFAFHADDAGTWASGWAVDNIEVSDGAVQTVQGYQVFLDGGYVTETPADVLTYQYKDLQYGVTYTAAVAALYCGLSEKVYYTWTSNFLYPPRNLDDAYVYNTNEVPLMWNPPMTGPGIPMQATPSSEYVHGIYDNSFGMIPANGVAVTEGETPNQQMLNGFRAPLVYGVVNNNNTYGYFDGEAPGVITTIGPWGGSGFANASEIVFDDHDYMYEIDNTGGTRIVSLIDGSTTSLGNCGVAATAMALDYTTNQYYVCDDVDNLYIVDLPDVTKTLVGNFSWSGLYMIGMTCDEEGNLWGYDIGSDLWWSIDKETGAATSVGSIGFDANFGQGLAYDQLSGMPVMSAFNSGSFAAEYRSVDVTTGMSTFLGNIGTPGSTQMGTICIPVVGGGGGGGVIPPGLMSFNVYQDANFIANVPYEGQKVDEWVYYVHNPVMPGTYLYDVSAVYDLGAYGFPGQTAESMMEGPDTVKVVWGFDIPFMETWTQGSFDFNSWSTASSNWKINSQVGNPEPSAEFTWDPAPGADYALSLTSAPLNADMMTEGKIFFEFEVKLNDRNMTGAEMLKVEVYNGQSWNQVASFANNGSFDWTFSKVDITQFSMGRVFQVRFTATGANSFDVISWFVDNIYIYRSCDSPTKLEGLYDWNSTSDYGALLKWNAPELPAPPQGWIFWGPGVNNGNGIGLDADAPFSVAARWAANTFPEYQGTSITKVKVFANDAGFTGWTLKVWTGANASTLVYSQVVTSQINVGAWTEITLTTPVPYDITKELWVGYTVDGLNGFFPAGCDDGPAVVGFGDKVSLDGVVWENLSDYGLNYNWNIQAYVEIVDAASSVVVNPVVDNTVYSTTAVNLKRGYTERESQATDNSTRAFSHFNVYRTANGGTDYTLLTEVAWVEGQEAYEYYDEVAAGTYCYKVTAVWESATDYCESAPAPAKLAPMNDYVCVVVTDVSNPEAGVFNLYPNPANDRVNITSGSAMSEITVYNYVGQVVYRSELSEASSVILNTGNYEAGVYVVRVNTEDGVVTRRVTITR